LGFGTEKDVVFGGQSRPLRWDIYRPQAAPSDAPIVLVLHGGGWRAGDRAMMTDACLEYARRGYIAIAPEYRLLGEANWPAPLDDVKLAVRSVREGKSGASVSTSRIFLTGFSAGAHLALLAASSADCAVAAVAAFFPPARITSEMGPMLGLSGAETLAAVSPIQHASKLPPTIVFCGDADNQTPPEMAIDLYKAIRNAGGTADIRLFSNLIHEFVALPGMLHQTIGDAVRFFDRTVITKNSFDAASDRHREWWASMMAAAGPRI